MAVCINPSKQFPYYRKLFLKLGFLNFLGALLLSITLKGTSSLMENKIPPPLFFQPPFLFRFLHLFLVLLLLNLSN